MYKNLFPYLAVALCARTLAHIYPAGGEVEVGVDLGVAPSEQRRLDCRAVFAGPDVGVPVLFAGRRPGRDIPGQDLDSTVYS